MSIGGADNKITIDKIDKQLNVVGFNNTISYKDGSPKVDNLGSGNTINKARYNLKLAQVAPWFPDVDLQPRWVSPFWTGSGPRCCTGWDSPNC